MPTRVRIASVTPDDDDKTLFYSSVKYKDFNIDYDIVADLLDYIANGMNTRKTKDRLVIKEINDRDNQTFSIEYIGKSDDVDIFKTKEREDSE